MALVRGKTAARLASVQALYQFESNGRSENSDSLCESIIKSYTDKDFKEIFDIPEDVHIELHKNHFKILVEFTINNLGNIDEVITSNLTGNWKYSNLHMSLAALLRVAIAEILFCPDIPPKVIVNEFTDIGTSLAKESEIGFINSLLDKVAKENRGE